MTATDVIIEVSMRVFVTGASGFIGGALVPELLDAGHEVIGLARSDEAAAALLRRGAEVRSGALDDLEALRAAAAEADGVIHLAFIHDFADYARAAETDARAIEALGAGLAGSGRPLVITGGTLGLAAGGIATEADQADPAVSPRAAGTRAALDLASRGVRSSVVRLAPSVHGDGDHGFVPYLIAVARAHGVSAYIGDGENRWPAVHRRDAARLFRLALENAPAGSTLHGIAEEGIPTRTIGEAIGRGLDVPVRSIPASEAEAHFGWIASFFGADAAASSTLTRSLLGWTPTGPGLLEDLAHGTYFAPVPSASA